MIAAAAVADLSPPDTAASARARIAALARVGHEAAGVHASAHGQPVVFGSTMGFLYPGRAPVAVLMVGAVGYEEMCVRTTWRALAEGISAAGAPCLRFDLPGVGDALEPADPQGLDDWRAAVVEAARFLRAATGRERIAVVGQGMGGALAALVARDLGAVEGVAFMAPVTSGKIYVRELSLWGAMLTDRIGIGPDPDHAGGCVVGGIAIEPGRLAALKAVDLQKLETAPAPRALMVGRANHGGDERFAERLEALGCAVERTVYEGYEVIASDPTQARPHPELVAKVAGWLASLAPAAGAEPTPEPVAFLPTALVGDGFRERPLRFGPDGRLFGVLCEPETPRAGPAIVFANAGRDYHVGWARTTIDQARAFARMGLASLRIDTAGVGDSPATPGFSDEILYSDEQVTDTVAAVEELARQGYDRVGLVGRCSGAYAVFHAACRDARVTDLVMINTERFVWDPRENIHEALRYAHRSIGDFGATLWRRNGLSRLLKGQLRVVPAAKYVIQRMIRKASVRLAPVLGGLTPEAKIYREVHRRFQALADRKTNVWIVYSVGDLGLIELDTHFGRGGRRLAGYPNVRRAMVEDADHNFTHKGARARLFKTLSDVFVR
ncbi:alpha/beta hydrolase family protein [Chenggangzhangella methanolivorans]|uniref:Alpha/beta fold hydrolase n=1 Tax=Chenggangzhangella methanolivorans TaxID=1437009 RepID=A0A9E6RBW1_9HYPH|nr:alpha/beta fold hydrolase [Chenggangzhangella methanolivorans]QZO01495.1 alpha/beta fold hydrolase [Chenggangzhangella methanolivorans]